MNLDKVNNDLKYYAVEFAEATHICCEDGQYRRRPGYIVVNKETDVVVLSFRPSTLTVHWTSCLILSRCIRHLTTCLSMRTW